MFVVRHQDYMPDTITQSLCLINMPEIGFCDRFLSESGFFSSFNPYEILDILIR